MKSKPDHLGPEFAAQFSDASVAAHYHLRPPYPEEVFSVLSGLIVDRPRAVLDVGTGTGEIARRIIDVVDRVDAVDPSAAMLERGRMLPGGDSAKISWITGLAEDAPLDPPYALVTAGASLHWMLWETVLPRLRDALSAHGVIAIIESHERRSPWAPALQGVIPHYSTNHGFRPYNVVDEIERRGLFKTLGRTMTAPVRLLQSTTDYVASFHARNGFSLDRMTPEAASAFDRAALEVVSPYANDAGQLDLQIVGEVMWGTPAPT